MSTKAHDAAAALKDPDLIRRAIDATPDDRPGHEGQSMPATEFAARIAYTNARTVRRYLAGDRALPRLLREKCIEIVAGKAAPSKSKRGPRIAGSRAAKARA